jgi:hypothetical protein
MVSIPIARSNLHAAGSHPNHVLMTILSSLSKLCKHYTGHGAPRPASNAAQTLAKASPSYNFGQSR